MANPQVLKILLGDVPVGHLTGFQDGKNLFTFDDSYVELGPSRPTLSLSFNTPGDEEATERKLRETWSSRMTLPPFFSNLLLANMPIARRTAPAPRRRRSGSALRGIPLDDGPRLRHYLAVWDRAVKIDVLVGCDRLAHVPLSCLKAIAQHEAQYRLRRAPGEAGKLVDPASLPRRKKQGCGGHG